MFRRIRGARSAPILTLTVVLALAGCGSGAGEDTGDDPPEVGPLQEFFEQAYGDFDEDQMVREMQQVEERVAECMAEQGFEYIPVDQTQGMSMSSEDLDVDWESREFAEEFGYGITTNPWGDPEEAPVEEEFVDPNAEYIESMSPTEQEAYFVALHGEQTFSEEDMEAEVEYDWEQAGCQGLAQHEVSDIGETDPAIASLEEELTTLWERTTEDPRVTEANAEWLGCMAGEGFTGIARVEDAQERIIEQSNAVYDEAYAEDGGGEPSDEEGFLAIEAQVQERLAEITEEEIRTAVADWDCKDEVDYSDTLASVSRELEQEFVDAHRDELEAWVEAVTAGRS